MSEKVIIAIETSCDETSVAILKGENILSNVVYSQIDLHAKYGGVVPSIARTAHKEKITDVFEEAVNQAGVPLEQLDYVAVTIGPGLAIALEVGIAEAVNLAEKLNIPVVPINHMEGHLFSAFVQPLSADDSVLSKSEMEFPALGVLVSGKHTELIKVNGVGQYEKLGQTLDDAAGEAFDKAGVMLDLGYPGGAKVSALALECNAEVEIFKQNQSTYIQIKDNPELRLPIPMLNSENYNVSYSGLKTALKQKIDKLKTTGEYDSQRAPLAKLFEEAAVAMLMYKIKSLLQNESELKQIWAGGGVVANKRLREELTAVAREKDIPLYLPAKQYTGDNAAMIGFVCHLYENNGLLGQLLVGSSESIDRVPRLSL